MSLPGSTPPGGSGKGGAAPPPKTPAVAPLNTAASTTAVNTETKSVIENNKAIQENVELRKNLGRLAGQTPSSVFIDYLKQQAAALLEIVSIGAIYTRTIDQLSRSTESYSASLQANTDNIAEATAQADRHLKGTREAEAAAEGLAAAYNMEASAINTASQAAQKMFATQLGAMGDVTKGMKDLQQNSVVLSRYLGVGMADVFNSWSERMDASNMTLEDAQLETAMLTKVTDQYTRALTSVSDEILKTAKVGKKELFEMTKAVNNEFKIGIPNVLAYTAAMAKMAVVAAKLGGTKNEQKDAMEGVLKLGKSLTTVSGSFGLMGMLGAEKLYAQYKSAPETLSKGLKERFDKRSGIIEKAPDMMRRQYQMETAGGTSELTLAALKELGDRSPDVDALAAQLQETTGGSAITSRSIAEAIKSGDMSAALKEYEEANKDAAQKQLDKAEELTKQASKTNDIAASIAKELKSIKHWLIGMAIASPIAGAIAGPLLGMLGTKLAAAAAAKAAAAAFIGPVAPAAAAGAGGLFTGAGALAALKTAAVAAAPFAVAAAIGYGTYKIAQGYSAAHAGDKEDEATGRKARGGAKWQNKVLGFVGVQSNEYELDTFIMNMSFKELDKKKAKIKLLTTEIETMTTAQKNGKAIDQELLAKKREELAAQKRRISAIVAEEERAFAESKAGQAGRLKAGIMTNVHEGAGRVAEKLNKQGKGAGSLQDLAFDFVSNMGENILKHGDFNKDTAGFLEGDSKEAKRLNEALAKAGIKKEDFAQAVSDRAAFVQMGGAKSGMTEKDLGDRQKIAETWGKSGRGAIAPIVPFSDTEREAMNKGTALSISVAGGEGQDGAVTPTRDASDNISIPMPNQRLLINGGALANITSDISGRNGSVGT